MRTTGVADFHREIGARPGIEATPWGSRLMEVADPFDNRPRFDEADPPADDGG